MTIMEQADLACTQGHSDKVYHVQLVEEAGGFRVTAQYGRRGGTLNRADKHHEAVPFAKAKGDFDTLIRSKLAKGYEYTTPRPEPANVPAPPVAKRQPTFTGVLPQLLNAIDLPEAERLICDPAFVAQEKHDGERRMLVVEAGEVYGLNRKGGVVEVPAIIAGFAKMIALGDASRLILDGEQIGDVLYVWDVLECRGNDLREQPLTDRLHALQTLMSFWCASGDTPIRMTTTATSLSAKRALLDSMVAKKKEGVVFKRASAPYTPGRPASGGDCLKYKLTASATVRVKARTKGKRSVALEVTDGAQWFDVGNVTIPANHDVPVAGAIVECRYLYVAGVGGSLYQPVYLGVRTDQDEADCTLAQLKYKGMDEADAA